MPRGNFLVLPRVFIWTARGKFESPLNHLLLMQQGEHGDGGHDHPSNCRGFQRTLTARGGISVSVIIFIWFPELKKKKKKTLPIFPFHVTISPVCNNNVKVINSIMAEPSFCCIH